METTKKMIGSRLIKRLHAIYRACGIDDEAKRAMLLDLTDGRTNSTKDLTNEEAQYLCGYLNGQFAGRLEVQTRDLRRRRSACLRRMQQLGLDTTDWNRVNAFCQDPRICGKPFYRLKEEELNALIAKLEAILRKQQQP
jgi:hypothetical protein